MNSIDINTIANGLDALVKGANETQHSYSDILVSVRDSLAQQIERSNNVVLALQNIIDFDFSQDQDIVEQSPDGSWKFTDLAAEASATLFVDMINDIFRAEGSFNTPISQVQWSDADPSFYFNVSSKIISTFDTQGNNYRFMLRIEGGQDNAIAYLACGVNNQGYLDCVDVCKIGSCEMFNGSIAVINPDPVGMILSAPFNKVNGRRLQFTDYARKYYGKANAYSIAMQQSWTSQNMSMYTHAISLYLNKSFDQPSFDAFCKRFGSYESWSSQSQMMYDRLSEIITTKDPRSLISLLQEVYNYNSNVTDNDGETGFTEMPDSIKTFDFGSVLLGVGQLLITAASVIVSIFNAGIGIALSGVSTIVNSIISGVNSYYEGTQYQIAWFSDDNKSDSAFDNIDNRAVNVPILQHKVEDSAFRDYVLEYIRTSRYSKMFKMLAPGTENYFWINTGPAGEETLMWENFFTLDYNLGMLINNGQYFIKKVNDRYIVCLGSEADQFGFGWLNISVGDGYERAFFGDFPITYICKQFLSVYDPIVNKGPMLQDEIDVRIMSAYAASVASLALNRVTCYGGVNSLPITNKIPDDLTLTAYRDGTPFLFGGTPFHFDGIWDKTVAKSMQIGSSFFGTIAGLLARCLPHKLKVEHESVVISYNNEPDSYFIGHFLSNILIDCPIRNITFAMNYNDWDGLIFETGGSMYFNANDPFTADSDSLGLLHEYIPIMYGQNMSSTYESLSNDQVSAIKIIPTNGNSNILVSVPKRTMLTAHVTMGVAIGVAAIAAIAAIACVATKMVNKFTGRTRSKIALKQQKVKDINRQAYENPGDLKLARAANKATNRYNLWAKLTGNPTYDHTNNWFNDAKLTGNTLDSGDFNSLMSGTESGVNVLQDTGILPVTTSEVYQLTNGGEINLSTIYKVISGHEYGQSDN